MWRPKNWKQFQRYQGQEKGVYTLIIGKSQFKKKKTYKFQSLHGLCFIMTDATTVECGSLTWSMSVQI